MKLNKQLLLVAIVPIVFIVGVVSFFVFLPKDLVTLTNLIGYMSSLSTTVMVLVYIVTTSRQLDTMGNQLKEMQYSRDVQIQPLPYLEAISASFDLPRYYVGPSTDFTKMELCSFVNASFNVINHGNGPAILVDFITHLESGPRGKEGEILDKCTLSPHVNCVPLKSKPSRKIDFQLDDHADCQKILEAMIKDLRIAITFVIVYKNALGKPFQENVAFWLMVKSEADLELLKSGLKVIRTAGIDFATQLQQHEQLAIAKREDKRTKLLDETNKKIDAILKETKVNLKVTIAPRSFMVCSISEEYYQQLIAQKSELEANITKEIHGCWEKHENEII